MHRSFQGLRILLSSSLVVAALIAIAAAPSRADVVYINQQEEAATGTFYYPVDANHVFTPAYTYVPVEQDVDFALEAQDGATLHIFDDANGTNELVVPAELKTAGQSQSITTGNFYNMGTVHLTQGWHKLYVEYTLLTLRPDTTQCYCRLHLTLSQLHDRVEPVSTEVSFDDWLPTANPDVQTSAVTVIVTQNDDITPAAGDSLIWSIDRVTSDAQGMNPISSSGVSISGDATTDAAGGAHAVITAVSPCVRPIPTYYIWSKMTDISQQVAVPAMPAVGANAAVVATTSYVYSMSPLFFPGPICGGNGGGGGGGGQAPYPKNVIKIGDVFAHKLLAGPKLWGHIDVWKLQVIDQFKNPYGLGSPQEYFTNVKIAAAPKNVHDQMVKMKVPGAASHWPVCSTFFDTNAVGYPFNFGNATFLFSFNQNWVNGKKYKLNHHFVSQTQANSTRTVFLIP